MPRLTHAAAFTFAFAIAAAARADGGQQREQAEAALTEGNQLVEREDYAAALAAYQRALALYPSPKIYFNIGQAERGLGHAVEATEAFERFLAESADASERLRAEAQGYLAALAEKVGRVAVSSKVAGARVLVDGQPRGETPLPRSLVVLAGDRLVRLERDGLAPREQRVTVAPGARVALVLDLEPPAVAAGGAPPPVLVSQPAPAEPARPVYRRWWFWTAAAAAVVVAGSAATYGIWRANRVDCPGRCIDIHSAPSP